MNDVRAGAVAAAIFGLAAASDFVDGRVARRRGTASTLGQTFDHATDMLFVTASLTFYSVNERLSVWVPLAVVLAVLTYLHDLRRASRGGDSSKARSRLGHAAGVMNYALVGLLTFEVVWSAGLLEAAVAVAAPATAALNLGAVALRVATGGRAPDQVPSSTATRVRRPRLMPTNGSATTP